MKLTWLNVTELHAYADNHITIYFNGGCFSMSKSQLEKSFLECD